MMSQNSQIEIHKYKYANTNTQVQILKYKYMNKQCRGPNDESFGPRFFALNGLYDTRLSPLSSLSSSHNQQGHQVETVGSTGS